MNRVRAESEVPGQCDRRAHSGHHQAMTPVESQRRAAICPPRPEEPQRIVQKLGDLLPGTELEITLTRYKSQSVQGSKPSLVNCVTLCKFPTTPSLASPAYKWEPPASAPRGCCEDEIQHRCPSLVKLSLFELGAQPFHLVRAPYCR